MVNAPVILSFLLVSEFETGSRNKGRVDAVFMKHNWLAAIVLGSMFFVAATDGMRAHYFVPVSEADTGRGDQRREGTQVPEGEPELRATLAWTDPLGTTVAAKALVNNLDLIVIAPDGKRYLGNHGLLEANVSREGGAPDRINNVENVFLEKPVPGVWRVLVAAHRIAWDQHRQTPSWDQDFALVVAGVERDPVPPNALSK